MTTNPTSLSAPEIWNDPIIKHMAFVFSRQDDDEQDRETTKYKNGRGFSAVDARICSSILSYVFKKDKISPKQYDILIQKSMKYSKQIPDLSFSVQEFRDIWLERNTPKSSFERKSIQKQPLLEYMFQEE